MKHIKFLFLAALCGVALFTNSMNAAEAKAYQVTGPVLEVTPSTITVQKGDEKWQIARDKKTKTTGNPKVGSTVTIHYTMTATDITVKDTTSTEKK